MQNLMKERNNLLNVISPRCGNRQIVFGKSSTFVKCVKCNRLLMRPTGGKTKVRAFVTKIFSWRR